MSTQHPDNVTIPFFAENSVMNGDDEIKEAFFVFSELGIDEQLWDTEGKEADNFVVKKLLSNHPDFFKKNILGKDKFITLRVPNPEIETDEGKILMEAMHSIPRNADLGKKFYGNYSAPIFETFLPMCSSEKEIIRVHEYYKRFVIGKQKEQMYDNDISLADWVGELHPADIRVTPLFETKEALLNADKYVEKYIQFEKIKEMQRVWFARSDPAMNYGSLANVLLAKIGLNRLHLLQQKTSVEILPILGCGSAPFRGNFKPGNVEHMLKGYPSVQTFTAQSAFKYDFPLKEVIDGIEKIKSTKRKEPLPIDEEFCTNLINKIEKDYQGSIQLLAPIINKISHYVPPRRKRKLHIDLFGYSRESKGVTLPRAITFCASLYSLGLPPDLLGLSTLTASEIETVRQYYPTIDLDIADALKLFNKNNLHIFPLEVQKKITNALKLFEYEVDEKHAELTAKAASAFAHGSEELREMIMRAAQVRKFLG